MRALVLRKPGQADLETIADPTLTDTNVLLKVRFVGFCGSDLNSFRGLNPLVTYPRILGHEVSATVVEDSGREAALSAGTNVAVSPYTNCGAMLLLSAWTSERLPVQPDSRCAKGWRPHRIHCDAARKTVSRQADSERVVPGGTTDGRISCRHTWTCHRRTTRLRFGVVAEWDLVS